MMSNETDLNDYNSFSLRMKLHHHSRTDNVHLSFAYFCCVFNAI